MKARLLATVCAISLTCACSTPPPQLPPDPDAVPSAVAVKLKQIGRVVNIEATEPLYAPRVIDSEPYRGVKIERGVAYGPDPRNVMDIFVPDQAATRARPVLLFVHGGGFIGGNRRLNPTSPFYDNVMLWATRNGMIGINMDYRVAPQHPWPAGAEDVASAVAWVSQEIATRGGDPKRIFLFGHSVGAAHVAAYLAHPQFQKVSGAGLAGALMLSGIYHVTPEVIASGPNVAAYYGEDFRRYEDRSSVRGLVATKVPLWFGYAELDPPLLLDQSQRIGDVLCRAGRCPAFQRFPSHSHLSEIYSLDTDDPTVGRSMLDFIHSAATLAN